MENKGKIDHAVITITLESPDGNYVNQRVVAEGGAHSHLFAEGVKKYASLVTSIGDMVFSGQLDDNLMETVLFLIRKNRLSPEMQKKICDDFCPADRFGKEMADTTDKTDAEKKVIGGFKDILSFLFGLNPDMTNPDEPKDEGVADDIGHVTLPSNIDEALNDALGKDDDDAQN